MYIILYTEYSILYILLLFYNDYIIILLFCYSIIYSVQGLM